MSPLTLMTRFAFLPVPRTPNQWLAEVILPLGLFLVLTGMLWTGDRKLYSQLFYVLVAFPICLLAILDRRLLRDALRIPTCLALIAFVGYVALSISWSGSEDDATSLIKRPFYILCLCLAFCTVARVNPKMLQWIVALAALAALPTAALTLIVFGTSGAEERLSGLGALYNPLLTSHVYGFFLTLWIAHWAGTPTPRPLLTLAAVAILGALIIATGSRTPLVALSATVLWIAALRGGPKGVIACVGLGIAGLALMLAYPEALLNRGFSYRPQIWGEVSRQILENPILGHGYDHPLRVQLDAFGFPFSDPHNMTLSVLYQGGMMGALLWGGLYGTALFSCWQLRRYPRVLICAAPVMYGLVAGMTEGGSFLSRPKEHWFLIWIPFSLLCAASLDANKHDKKN